VTVVSRELVVDTTVDVWVAVTVVITEVTVGIEEGESCEVEEFGEFSTTELVETVVLEGAPYGAPYEEAILDVEGRAEVEDVGTRDAKEESGN
jgi:hypothetical protein